MSARLYQRAADALLLTHFAYVSFVGVGFALIWIGFAFRWQWVRGSGFRLAHFLAMGIVLAEALLGVTCPLTMWENALRIRAGGAAYEEGFMQHWVSRLMFYDWSPTTFLLLYAALFVLIVVTWVVVPPRWPRRKTKREAPNPNSSDGEMGT